MLISWLHETGHQRLNLPHPLGECAQQYLLGLRQVSWTVVHGPRLLLLGGPKALRCFLKNPWQKKSCNTKVVSNHFDRHSYIIVEPHFIIIHLAGFLTQLTCYDPDPDKTCLPHGNPQNYFELLQEPQKKYWNIRCSFTVHRCCNPKNVPRGMKIYAIFPIEVSQVVIFWLAQ